VSKYRKALLIGLASIVLTITGLCIRGMQRSTHLRIPTDNMVPPSQATIEVGAAIKSDEQLCWRPGSTRNIGIAESSCDFWERQIGSGGTPQ
jgi:hypothetical protein